MVTSVRPDHRSIQARQMPYQAMSAIDSMTYRKGVTVVCLIHGYRQHKAFDAGTNPQDVRDFIVEQTKGNMDHRVGIAWHN